MVNHVMDTQKGGPVMLGLIYAELARRLNLPIFGVNLPRNFVLCYYDEAYYEDPNRILFYINPSGSGSRAGPERIKALPESPEDRGKGILFLPLFQRGYHRKAGHQPAIRL
jgi:hypothetical protein